MSKSNLNLENSVCHCNLPNSVCCGIFNIIKDGAVVCNECGQSLSECVDNGFAALKAEVERLTIAVSKRCVAQAIAEKRVAELEAELALRRDKMSPEYQINCAHVSHLKDRCLCRKCVDKRWADYMDESQPN